MKGLSEKDFEGVIFETLAGGDLYTARESDDFALEYLCDLKMLADYICTTQPAA